MLPLHQGHLGVSYEPKYDIWMSHTLRVIKDEQASCLHAPFDLKTFGFALPRRASPVNLICASYARGSWFSLWLANATIPWLQGWCAMAHTIYPLHVEGWLCLVKAWSHVILHPTTFHYQRWTTYSTCINYAPRNKICTKMTKLATLNTQPTIIKTIFACNKTCKQEDLIEPHYTCIIHA